MKKFAKGGGRNAEKQLIFVISDRIIRGKSCFLQRKRFLSFYGKEGALNGNNVS